MTTDAIDPARKTLAAHFRAAIGDVMAEWRACVASDGEVTAGDALPRAQLEDHLPAWLLDFADVLAAPPGANRARAEDSQARDAAVHGLTRWQQGYD